MGDISISDIRIFIRYWVSVYLCNISLEGNNFVNKSKKNDVEIYSLMVKGECVGECVCEGDRALDVEVICSKISIFGDNNNYTVLFKYVLISKTEFKFLLIPFLNDSSK